MHKVICPLFFLLTHLSAQPLADGRNVYLGNIINNGSNIPPNFITLWNQVTPENAGKWGSVETSQDFMNWNNLDKIYQFAKSNNLPFRQHTFVWGQQQPWWIQHLDQASQRVQVEEWIRQFGERYPDTDYIDVVNEPLHENPVYKDALGGSGATGWDWVIWAFEKARQYCPTAELHINEYGVLNGWVSVNNYVKIINVLKERNLIDGIGLQGHFLESTTGNTIKTKLNQLAQTGLPIYITEYDVKIAGDAQHLAKYKDQFPVMYEHPAVAGITLWGYIQGQMWRAEGFLIYQDGRERPAMTWLRDYFAGTSTISAEKSTIAQFQLEQNTPNPFNSRTKIHFAVPEPGQVRVDIYDALGRPIKRVQHAFLSSGSHTLFWDGTDAHGQAAPSGVYVCFLQVDDGQKRLTMSKKMLLVR